MAIKEWVDKKSPRQRERLAIAVVTTLALVALLWGVKIYFLPQYQMHQGTKQGEKLPMDKGVISPASIFKSTLLTTIAEQ